MTSLLNMLTGRLCDAMRGRTCGEVERDWSCVRHRLGVECLIECMLKRVSYL